jgi:F5/8 type C domain
MKKTLVFAIVTSVMWISSSEVGAVDYYVDGTGGNDSWNGLYASYTGDDNGPWETIGKANSTLGAGDTVYIRAGTYAETISPAVSGQSDARITYAAYNSETVKVTGYRGMYLIGISYISVDGLIFWKNPWQFFHIKDGSNHVEVKNCLIDGDLTGGGGPYCSSEVSHSLYAHIHHNTFQNPFRATTEDANEKNFLGITGTSDFTPAYALIEYNVFKDGPGHEQLDLYRTSYNVVRFNTFMDTGLYTQNHQESVDMMLGMGRGAEHNLIEHNEFYETNGNIGDGNCFGIRLSSGSKYTIVRYNRIYDVDRNFISYGTKEGRHTEYNAIYSNTIHNSGGSCKSTEADIKVISDHAGDEVRFNSFCNNIVHAFPETGIIIIDNSTGWENVHDNEFRANVIQGDTTATDVTKGVNVDYSWIKINHYTISEAQTRFPDEFKYNIDVDPLFENEAGHDFHLKAGSPAINAGDWLTTITSASGSGDSFAVAQSQFFMDGFGIVEGDSIQLEGQTQRAKITNVDYSNNIITVDQELEWTTGQGVALNYEGTAPDIGAYEFMGVACLPIEQTGWVLVHADSKETGYEAENSFDGDPDTFWSTEWSSPDPDPCHPHEIRIDLGGFHDICGFSYLPRQDVGAGDENGMIKDYEFRREKREEKNIKQMVRYIAPYWIPDSAGMTRKDKEDEKDIGFGDCGECNVDKFA